MDDDDDDDASIAAATPPPPPAHRTILAITSTGIDIQLFRSHFHSDDAWVGWFDESVGGNGRSVWSSCYPA
jgi:hypothetical protein